MHGSARLVLAGDGTFVMTHMPKYVVQADSGESRTPTLTCSGTWSFDQTVQNLTLSPTKPSSAECRGDELSVAGRNNERTIAFGIDSGSGNPLCFELLRPGSNLTAQGIDECQTY